MMKLSKVLEYIWLAVALLCVLISIRYTIRVGVEGAWKFYAISIVSFLMFLFRRAMNR